MAVGDPLPTDQLIYRALPYSRINKKDKRPKESAFFMKEERRDAEGNLIVEAETYLSFGVDQQSAIGDLHGIELTCSVKVADIVALGLQVVEGDPGKVRVYGVPLLSQNETMALTLAKDLRNISSEYS